MLLLSLVCPLKKSSPPAPPRYDWFRGFLESFVPKVCNHWFVFLLLVLLFVRITTSSQKCMRVGRWLRPRFFFDGSAAVHIELLWVLGAGYAVVHRWC